MIVHIALNFNFYVRFEHFESKVECENDLRSVSGCGGGVQTHHGSRLEADSCA